MFKKYTKGEAMAAQRGPEALGSAPGSRLGAVSGRHCLVFYIFLLYTVVCVLMQLISFIYVC